MMVENIPELTCMMMYMEPMVAEVPGDGYKYIRAQGDFVDLHLIDGWETIAEWHGYGNVRERDIQDVIMRRELMSHEIDQHAVYVYPHEKIIGQVQRVLVL